MTLKTVKELCFVAFGLCIVVALGIVGVSITRLIAEIPMEVITNMCVGAFFLVIVGVAFLLIGWALSRRWRAK